MVAPRPITSTASSQAVKVRSDSTLIAVVGNETKHLEKVQVLDKVDADETKAEVRTTIRSTTSVSSKQPHLEGVGTILSIKAYL
jgi:hypothetical protein